MTTINYAELAQQFGAITYEGKTYTLTAQADYSNRVFPGWWGDASEGESYWTEFDCEAVDAAGNTYRVVWQFRVVKGAEPEPDTHDWDDVARVDLVEQVALEEDSDEEDSEDGEPSLYTQVYNHPTLRHYVASHKSPHIDALDAAGLLDALTVDQCAAIVRLAQTAYQNGQRAQGAERIDSDAVWVDGVGGLERQADGSWRLSYPDAKTKSAAAAALGSSTSEAKAAAARANGKRGGRPRKNKE